MARNRLRWALGRGVVLAIPLATPARALLIEYAFSVQVTSAEPPLDASFTPGAPATVVALIDDATAPGFPVPETARYFGAFVFGSFAATPSRPSP